VIDDELVKKQVIKHIVSVNNSNSVLKFDINKVIGCIEAEDEECSLVIKSLFNGWLNQGLCSKTNDDYLFTEKAIINFKGSEQSYFKGLSRLLDNEGEAVKQCLIMYLLHVNSYHHSFIFPSTTLAKVYMESTEGSKHQIKECHSLVKLVLKDWVAQGLCKLNSISRNKEIYIFTEDAFKIFKSLGIDYVTAAIKNGDKLGLKDDLIMKKRDDKIKDILDNFLLPDV
jgi:hypothetical protein